MLGNNWSMCEGKKAFDTYYQAAKSARTLRRIRDGSKLTAYKCPGCGKFHVGNTTHLRHRRRNRHNMKGYLEHGRIQISE